MRRVHVPTLTLGDLPLAADQSHHLRDVLRVAQGETIELFDTIGRTARAAVIALSPVVVARVEAIDARPAGPRVTVASAVPKGDRADWMIEKLSEIGVDAFVPLRTARSVVHPEGAGKLDRWKRIAVESAKQCKRVGVMRIDALAGLDAMIRSAAPNGGIFFSTGDAPPLQQVMSGDGPAVLFVGPEGGWTPEEESRLRAAGLTAASLGPTILRIETAAVLSAGLFMLLRNETHVR